MLERFKAGAVGLKDRLGLSKVDRKKTYELLARAREPRPEEQKALEELGWVFFSIEAKSLKQIAQENSDHFRNVDCPTEAEKYVPPVMTVAVNLKHPIIDGSFGQPQDTQLKLIEKFSRKLKKQFPEAQVLMLPVSTYSQIDITYKKETGKDFFRDFFARCLDQDPNSKGNMVFVGRAGAKLRVGFLPLNFDSSKPSHVSRAIAGDYSFYEFLKYRDRLHIGALPAIVFIKK